MAGQLVQVATETVTSAVAGIDFDNKITTDDVYLLTISNWTPETDIKTPYLQFKNSSGVVSSANYDYAYKLLRTNTTFGNVSQVNGTASRLGGSSIGTATSESLNSIIYIYNAYNSSEYTFYTQEDVMFASNVILNGSQGGGVLDVAEQHTGLYISHLGTSNIASGTFTMYRCV